MEKSVILISGGPDSATLLAWAKANGYKDIDAVYLSAGHATDKMELRSADKLAKKANVRLEVIDVSQMVAALGGQRMLIHSQASIMPFGNAIVLSMAITYAIKLGANNIMIALHEDDAKENLEYTREFINAIEALARSTHPEITLLTPFIGLGKSEVFKVGKKLGVDYSGTWSCVRPGNVHCGQCGACRARAKAFALAKMKDPTRYKIMPASLDSVPVAVHE